MTNNITKKDFDDALSFFKKNKTTTFGGVIVHEYQVDVIRKEMVMLAGRAEKAEAERDVMTKRMMDISQEYVVLSERNIDLKKRLDAVEAENKQLKAWLDTVIDFDYWDEEHYQALNQYEKWRSSSKNNPSASAKASALDDTPKAH